ncbi:MAG: YjcZ family sporulation protein [Erysipelotrichaceae bacterium]|nr:YjcZ family sporulation protein [Erysipelotrichaceae bacterium]
MCGNSFAIILVLFILLAIIGYGLWGYNY